MPASQEAKEKEATDEQAPDPQEVIREMREIQSDAAQLSEIEELEYSQTMKLVESMKSRILPLDDALIVLPGHGGSTTIGVEKSSNPFLLNM